MDNDAKYTVTVSGGGMDFKREVSREVGEQIVVFAITGTHAQSAAKPAAEAPAQLQPHSTGADQTPAVGQTAPSVNTKTMSIREFFTKVEPKRNPDRIAAIGRYLEVHKEQNTFNREDLITHFEAAREPVPANLTRDISWAVKNGWITESSSEKDHYYLTNTGQEVVDNKFPPEDLKKTRLSKGRKSSSRNGVS